MFAALYCITHEYKMYSRVFGVASLFLLIMSSFVLNNQEMSRKILLQTKSVIVSIISKITLRRFLVGLILVRFVRYIFFLYNDYKVWIFIAKKNINIPLFEIRVISALIFEILMYLIIVLDILTLKKIKKKLNSFIRLGIISCVLTAITFVYMAVNRIVNMIEFTTQYATGHSWWEAYHFSYYDVLYLLVFITAIVQIIISLRYKEKLIYRTTGFADPFYTDVSPSESEILMEYENKA